MRAIAVIAVVLYHFNASWIPGGFAGVDVFFVISGFLMTGIIFRGIENDDFSILKFYVARANRIIPALAALCIAVLVVGWLYLTPLDYRALGRHVGSSMGFISNVIYWRESGYFDAASHEKWLLHTWSLSVEWQFYMIYPIALVSMRKFMRPEKIKTSILIGTIFGFIICVVSTYKWPNPAYYLLHARAWEMMLGGVAFLYPVSIKEERKKLLEWFGLSLIISSYFLISKENPWPGYLSLIPVAGSFLIIQSQRNDSIITSNVVFQNLGKWSYSIYLWHWPFVVSIYYFSLDSIWVYIGIALSVIFGFLSNKYIEKIRFRNDFKNRSSYFKCRPLYLVFIVGTIGSYVFIDNGINRPIRAITKSDEVVYVNKYHRTNYKKHLKDAYSLQCDFFDESSQTAKTNDIPETCINNGNGGIFIWGDSHAQALSYGIRKVFKNININQVTSSSCRPLIKNDVKTSGEFKKSCDRSNEFARKSILKINPEVIILAQKIDHDENKYNEILSYVASNKLRSKVLLVGPVPQWEPSLPNTIAKRHFNKTNKIFSDASFVNEVFVVNKKLHHEYDHTELKHVSLVDYLCDERNCLAKVDDENTPLVWDYGHLSLEGSVYVANRIIRSEIDGYLVTTNTEPRSLGLTMQSLGTE